MNTTPFGFAIVNKDSRIRYLAQQKMPDIEDIVRRLDESVPDEAPHCIVELYTKEQLEQEIQDLKQELNDTEYLLKEMEIKSNE